MKLKYERFVGLGCFYIRGVIEPAQFKMLLVGLETILNELEEPTLIHGANAFFEKNEITVLQEFKKRVNANSKHKVYWIMKEKPLGDYGTIELAMSRFAGGKFRQIAERIRLDDQLFTLKEKIKLAEQALAQLTDESTNVNQVLLNSESIRAQRKTLNECLEWQRFRIGHQSLESSTDEEINEKTKVLIADLRKQLGVEVDL